MKLKIYDRITACKETDAQWKTITVAFLGDSVTQGCFEVYKTGKRTIDTVYSYQDAFSTKFREIMNLLYPRQKYYTKPTREIISWSPWSWPILMCLRDFPARLSKS